MKETTNENRSTLASLRAVIPIRHLEPGEALQVAELQAARLLELPDSTGGPLDWTVIAGLPRIRIRREELPTSGMSFWDGHSWVIVLNASEPRTRQRFTLLHEYKHIVDHGATDRLYPDRRRQTAGDPAEQGAGPRAPGAPLGRTATTSSTTGRPTGSTPAVAARRQAIRPSRPPTTSPAAPSCRSV